MGKFFAILGAIIYYLLYPIIILILLIGPLIEFEYLIEVYRYNAPRNALGMWFIWFIGLLLFLSFRFSRLGWLYKKIPVMVPFFQMCFVTLIGLDLALIFANIWADKQLYSEGVAIILSIVSFVLARVYLSYWYTKYPISYRVHKS